MFINYIFNGCRHTNLFLGKRFYHIIKFNGMGSFEKDPFILVWMC